MRSLWRDLEYAFRTLRARPWLSAAVVASIALGIGVNTAVFSVAYGVLWRPLPYTKSDDLVRLFQSRPDQPEGPVSPVDYQDWSRLSTTIEALAAWRVARFDIVTDGSKETLEGASVSASLFDVLGLRLVRGRSFSAEEDTAGGAPVAVISERLWGSRFGRQDDVLGRTIALGGTTHTIVGVLPARVSFPADTTDIWTPLRLGDQSHRMRRTERYLNAIARRKPGAALEGVQADMSRVAATLASESPSTNAGTGIVVVSLGELIRGPVRTPLILLLAVSTAVLLIACANVAHLLLARASGRRLELAMRTALGATRRDLLSLSLLETSLLAIVGGSLGVALAWSAVEAVRPLIPRAVPRHSDIAVDVSALMFAFAGALLIAAVCAIAPTWSAWRMVGESLQSARPTVAGGVSPLGPLVIVLQVSLSLVLLVGTLMTARSLHNVLSVDAGFDSRGVVTASLSLPSTYFMEGGSYRSERVLQQFERAMHSVRRLPGVQAVGLVSNMPLGDDSSGTRFTIEGRTLAGPDDVPTARYRVVSTSYFEVLRARLLKGRYPAASDAAAGDCVVNESMARRHWPGQEALGARVRRGGVDSTQPYLTVVGVIADMKQAGLDKEVAPEIFIPHTAFPVPGMSLVVRTPRDLTAFGPEARAALAELAPIQFEAFRPFDDIVWRTISGRAFTSTLLGAAAAIALALALLGVYAVMANVTARRSREIAVRLALGGQPSSILAAVFGRAIVLVAIALAVGTAAAYAVARLGAHYLFGLQPFDPVTYGAAIVMVGAVALVANLEPARRALRVNPVSILRMD